MNTSLLSDEEYKRKLQENLHKLKRKNIVVPKDDYITFSDMGLELPKRAKLSPRINSKCQSKQSTSTDSILKNCQNEKITKSKFKDNDFICLNQKRPQNLTKATKNTDFRTVSLSRCIIPSTCNNTEDVIEVDQIKNTLEPTRRKKMDIVTLTNKLEDSKPISEPTECTELNSSNYVKGKSHCAVDSIIVNAISEPINPAKLVADYKIDVSELRITEGTDSDLHSTALKKDQDDKVKIEKLLKPDFVYYFSTNSSNQLLESTVTTDDYSTNSDDDMNNHCTNNDVDMNSSKADTNSFLDHSFEPSIDDCSTIDDVKECKNFQLFTINEKQVLLVMDLKSKVYCYGLMRIQLLKGAATVLGYYLHPFQSVEFYSPRGSSLLYIESIEMSKDSEFTEMPYEFSYTILAVLRNLQPGQTCILCEKLILPKISFLEKYTAQYIFPKVNGSVDCIFQSFVEDKNVLKINGHWGSVAKQIKEETKLLICGGKSVGKSYLLRYLINSLLCKHRKVLVIDLDPGQPEFTIPGCVSATVIEEPVFGPNYTHMREATRCIFVPEVNISNCFVAYIRAVEALILACSDLTNMPTLINFMGYTRGMGFEILSSAIRVVKPTIIVEIKGYAASQNYKENLEHASVVSTSSRLTPQATSLPFFLHIPTISWGEQVKSWHLEPRQIREMLVLCYFGQILMDCDNSLSHRNVPVYQVDLTKIKILYNNKVVSPAVVNANLVALCTPYGNTYNCHGWGIVRAVDLEQNVCYLITPLSTAKLEDIDYFIIGSVNLPPSLYMTTKNCSDLIPYVAKGIIKDFGAIPKRSHLPRQNMNL